MIRNGTADLPLHYGKVPAWLAERMAKLGLAVTEALLEEYGTGGWLERMSDPYWFQALGCLLGMDWHSSGITTSVLGALKRSINPRSRELGLHICGGRGRYSRKTPDELREISSLFGTPGEELATASRLSAKVDNTCIQDGFQLYLHTFALDRSGEWCVVQQGMNQKTGMARRYHWLKRAAGTYLDSPQTGIVGENEGDLVNLSNTRAADSREAILDFLSTHPEVQEKELIRLGLMKKKPKQLSLFDDDPLIMPSHHEVRDEDVRSDRLGSTLAAAYECSGAPFTDILLLPGMGPRTMQSLALVSEIVYGKPNRFRDPARFSFAHGGKDGHPFPVPTKIYDNTIKVMERAVSKAKIGEGERLASLKRIHQFTQELEQKMTIKADVQRVIEAERAAAPQRGGRVCGS